jgi:glycosyltransferase involved in cell wall biosynthesis/predicted  nucleic acid-binding Zn-ribbon protein
MERVKGQRQAKPAAAANGKRANQAMERGVRKLAAQVEAVHGDIASLRTLAKTTEDAVSELRLVEVGQEIRVVGHRLDDLTSRVETVEQGLEGVGAQAQDSNAALAKSLDAVSRRVRRLSSQLVDLSSRIDDVDRGMGGLGEQGEVAKRTLARLREVREDIQTLEKGMGAVSELRREVASLGEAIGELREDVGRPGAIRRGLKKAGGGLRRAGGGLRKAGGGLRKAGRKVRRTRIWRLARRKPVRALRRTRARTARILRLTRSKIRRGLRYVRRRLGPRLGRLDQHRPKKLRTPNRYLRKIKLEDPPVISIVTPSFNQVEFIGKTIRSVLGQGYPRLEYIVKDGGSTDGTIKLLDSYRRSLHHCEVGADEGQAHAINLGFSHASGEVMAYLNSDDLILPGALAYVARYFQRHPEVDVVYGHRVLVDEDDKEVGRWIVPKHRDETLSWADYVPQETLYWRRRLWEENEIELNEESQFALDWDLMLQFRDAGARIVRLPRFLGAFRVHSAQKSSADLQTAGAREMAKIRERVHGRRVTREEIRHNIRGYMLRHVVLDRLYRARLLRY